MTKSTPSKPRRKGIFRFVVGIVILAPLGYFLTLEGWNAFATGQVWIHSKVGAKYLATADGPRWFSFYAHAGLALVAGILFAGLPIACAISVMLATPDRRAERFEFIGSQNLTKNSPTLSWWVVVLVLCIVVIFLASVFSKWH